MKKQEFLESLLGRLSLEEKVAQMMVLGQTGTIVDPLLLRFIRQYGLGGLRVTPNSGRKFVRYLKEGSKGMANVTRPPQWGEKMVDTGITAYKLNGETYASFLNQFRTVAFERRGLGIPLHTVADCEAGGGNCGVPYLISMPSAMGFGSLGDLDLLERSWTATARQVKAIGVDWLHSPVVDVNVNPLNPEISTRSFSADPDVVTACAAATLRGMKAANIIGCLKHYPGRGDSASDAHFGLPVVNASKQAMYDIHLKPYRELIKAGLVESIMLAHTVFPNLDPDREIATVSEFLTKEILRGELRFQGVITTDSMTMGGLMERYSVSEAAVKAINNGVDLILLKDDNSLRFELHSELVAAVRAGKIREEAVDRSILRVWSLKYDHGLFADGGVVPAQDADPFLRREEFRRIGREMSEKVCRVERMEPGVLPLRPEQKILLIDRVTDTHLFRNDFWNYPGMFYDFLRRFSDNIMYCDYTAKNAAAALETAKQFRDECDVIVLTSDYDRASADAPDKRVAEELAELGRPLIQISANPYRELVIPDSVKNVIVTYGLLHEQMEAASRLLFGR